MCMTMMSSLVAIKHNDDDEEEEDDDMWWKLFWRIELDVVQADSANKLLNQYDLNDVIWYDMIW